MLVRQRESGQVTVGLCRPMQPTAVSLCHCTRQSPAQSRTYTHCQLPPCAQTGSLCMVATHCSHCTVAGDDATLGAGEGSRAVGSVGASSPHPAAHMQGYTLPSTAAHAFLFLCVHTVQGSTGMPQGRCWIGSDLNREGVGRLCHRDSRCLEVLGS